MGAANKSFRIHEAEINLKGDREFTIVNNF